jgi:hypothetical protein
VVRCSNVAVQQDACIGGAGLPVAAQLPAPFDAENPRFKGVF